LRQLDYAELWSTFVVGNDSSMLWHWRSGFRLFPHPGSRRRLLQDFVRGSKNKAVICG
jgi:hypothetical protein